MFNDTVLTAVVFFNIELYERVITFGELETRKEEVFVACMKEIFRSWFGVKS